MTRGHTIKPKAVKDRNYESEHKRLFIKIKRNKKKKWKENHCYENDKLVETGNLRLIILIQPSTKKDLTQGH